MPSAPLPSDPAERSAVCAETSPSRASFTVYWTHFLRTRGGRLNTSLICRVDRGCWQVRTLLGGFLTSKRVDGVREDITPVMALGRRSAEALGGYSLQESSGFNLCRVIIGSISLIIEAQCGSLSGKYEVWHSVWPHIEMMLSFTKMDMEGKKWWDRSFQMRPLWMTCVFLSKRVKVLELVFENRSNGLRQGWSGSVMILLLDFSSLA